MRIGVDIDGVLADFQEPFVRRLVAVTGRDLYPVGDYATRFPCWDHPQKHGYTEAELDAVWGSIRKDRVFWYSLDAYPGTLAAVAYLAERIKHLHDDVYFITARPGIDAKRQTEMWLEKEFRYISPGPILPTVLISSHKGLCAQALGLDVYIDDRWENCLETASMHWKRESPNCRTFLMDRPWNQGHENEIAELGITRVSALPGICDPVPNSVPTPRRNTSVSPS